MVERPEDGSLASGGLGITSLEPVPRRNLNLELQGLKPKGK